MPTRRLILACAAAVLLCAAPATAQGTDIKPPIRGLVSMGAYRFVSSTTGAQPNNTLAKVRAKPGVLGGFVVVASWQQLQPTRNGPLRPHVIDQALQEIRIYNAHHPKHPMAVKLRIWGGFMAPDWAKSIGGAPIAFEHNGHDRTVGRFWLPAYRNAWTKLQNMLAARYDDDPLIREVSITQCMSITAEPFVLPTNPMETGMATLRNAPNGFNDHDFKNCLRQSVSDYSAWKRTRIVLSVNPYRSTTAGGPGDAAFTKTVMRNCRKAIGEQCVFDNHDLDNHLSSPLVPIYNYMKKLGPEIEFQTFNKTPANFPATIRFGIAHGASSIELYQDFGGFPDVPLPELKRWASWFEPDTGGNGSGRGR